MDNQFSLEFSKFLNSGDFEAANQIIKRAYSLNYPIALINSWEISLAKSEKAILSHPLEFVSDPIDDHRNITTKFGINIKQVFRLNIKNYLADNNLKADLVDNIVEVVFNSIDQSTGKLLLPDLTAFEPCENLISYSIEQYIKDAPDVINAVKSGVIVSAMDHLLRSGYIEILEGHRYSSIILAHESARYNGKLLYIVDNYSHLSSKEVSDLHSIQLGQFSADIFSVSDNYVYTSTGSCINAGFYFFQNISDEHNIFILLKNKTLTSSSIKWIIDVKLKDRTAIFGHSSNKRVFHSTIEASHVNMLLSDITNGCVIANPLDILSLFSSLKGYKSAFGFFHALLLAMHEDGINFLLKHEILSQVNTTTGIVSKSDDSYWSPFYWRLLTNDRSYSLSVPIRNDFLKTWSRHLDSINKLSSNDKNDNKLWVDIEDLVVKINPNRIPTIAIIIPFRDKIELLENCIKSLTTRIEEVDFKIYAINNNSCEKNTFSAINRLQKMYPKELFCVDIPGSFNYAKINNQAANMVNEDYLLFLNNDIFIDSDFSLTTLLKSHYFFNACVTGSKLLYPSGKIQHNGLATATERHIPIFSPFRGLTTSLNYLDSFEDSKLHPWERTHECSAVTAACMLIRRTEFVSIGGFDESLQESYNDVDLCFRAKTKYTSRPIICSTESKIFHLEGQSRTLYANSEQQARLYDERTYFFDKYSDQLLSPDKFIGPNPLFSDISRYFKSTLDRKYSDSSLASKSDIDLDILYGFQHFKHNNHGYACVFVHYDKDALITDDCIQHLKKLGEYCDLYFVSSSALLASMPDQIEKAKPFCKKILVRNNSGYDFGCWSHVIRESYAELCSYEGVVLVNDSNWGPLNDFSDTFSKIERLSSEADFFGLTSCNNPTWHLQSYFILYSKNVFNSLYFRQHWFDIGILRSKRDVIKNYEVNWCYRLKKLGFEGISLYGDVSAINPTHEDWERLLRERYPYLKKELLRDNPLSMDLQKLPEILSAFDESWISYILNYLKRYGKENSNIAKLVLQSLSYPSRF